MKPYGELSAIDLEKKPIKTNHMNEFGGWNAPEPSHG